VAHQARVLRGAVNRRDQGICNAVSAPCNHVQSCPCVVMKRQLARTNLISTSCHCRFVRGNQETDRLCFHLVGHQSCIFVLKVHQARPRKRVSGMPTWRRLGRGQPELKGNLACKPCSHLFGRARANFERKLIFLVRAVGSNRGINECRSFCVSDNRECSKSF